MAISKSKARQLAMNATEMGSHVLRGVLKIKPDGANVDGTDVLEWLAQYADSELVLIAVSVGELPIEDEIKTCYTCGRDYTGKTCPHCAEVRARLRG